MYLMLILIFYCLKPSETKLELPTIQQAPIIHCAVKIFTHSFAPNFIVLQQAKFNMDALFHVSKSTTIVNLRSNVKVKTKDMFHYYIFMVQEASEFEQFIKKYYYTPSWNPRATFLIILDGLEENIQQILNVSWQYYAVNLNILYGNTTNVNVYTYFPFCNGNCNNTKQELLANCEEDLAEWFPSKVPKRSNGCPFTVAAKILSPYVINTSVYEDNTRTAGLEVVILNNVFKAANLTVKYIPYYSHWGYKFADGTATLMYDRLLNRNCDAMIGHITRNDSFYYDFDATYYYILDNFKWFVPKAKPVARWKNLFMVFDFGLWLGVIGIFFVNALVWWFISRGGRESSLYNNLSWCFTNTWSVLLQISVDNPTLRSLKILYIFWTIAALLIGTAYQSKLVSVLTTPIYEHQISNMRELVESRLPFGSLPNARDYFQSIDCAEDKMIYDNFIPCDDAELCIRRMLEGKFSFMSGQMFMQYRLEHEYRGDVGKIYGFEKIVKFSAYSMYTTRGYAFVDRFNEIILLLQSNGLIDKWTRDSFSDSLKEDEPLQPLKLSHLMSIFMILIIGWAVSLICFIVEKLYNKYNN